MILLDSPLLRELNFEEICVVGRIDTPANNAVKQLTSGESRGVIKTKPADWRVDDPVTFSLLVHFNCWGNGRLPLLLGVIVNIKTIVAGQLDFIGNDLIFQNVLVSRA